MVVARTPLHVEPMVSNPRKRNLGRSVSVSARVRQFDQDRRYLPRPGEKSTMPVADRPDSFRTNRLLDFSDLSFRARRNDTRMPHQRLGALLELMLHLLKGGFRRRSGFFVMLLRQRAGSLL